MGMFDKAKVVAPAKAPKKGKDQIAMPGIQQVAELDALIKSLTAIHATASANIKTAAMDKFIERANGKRPESFRGIDGSASASVECRKRGTNSPLNDEQVALLLANGLVAEKSISVNKMFGINPIYAEDTKLLEQVETALSDIVPEDFIVVQEEKFKHVVTDAVMDKAFKDNAPRAVLEIVSTLALKPKLDTIDIDAIMKNVRSMIKIEATEEEAE